MQNGDFTSWIEIDLKKLTHNIQLLKEQSGREIMAIVKANAYGHGKPGIVKALYQRGIKWFGIARIEEALEVRQNAADARILVMGFTPPDQVATAVHQNVSLAVYDLETARMYSEKAILASGKAVVHVKFETGMGRLGYIGEDVVEFFQQVQSLPGLEVEGVFTHFACADDPFGETTSRQIEKFNAVLATLKSVGYVPEIIHASNSPAIINYPDAGYTMVRSGIALYGMDPSPETPLPDGFEPVLTLKSRLTSIKTLPAGHGVSYGHYYHTPKAQKIGVVGIGYADGFRRRLGSSMLVRGKRVPVVGIVAMDQCMVVLDDVPEAEIGEEVVVIGRQGSEEISAEELANDWNTIAYEVTCGMSARLPRVYLD